MTNKKKFALLKEIMNSKVRLPNLKCIEINRFSENVDIDLNKFLRNCIPAQLKSFTINFISATIMPIKAKIYCDSLSKVANVVTKELYIRFFEFSAKEFQLLVKASYCVQEITFCDCSISCSTALDFGKKIKYKTNFLSFQCCGNIDNYALTTDWKYTPSSFSNIVNAIGNSGLKDSLKQIDISYNQTLDKSSVQALLDSQGIMSILID